MLASYIPAAPIPGVGRIAGTVWSLTDLALGEPSTLWFHSQSGSKRAPCLWGQAGSVQWLDCSRSAGDGFKACSCLTADRVRALCRHGARQRQHPGRQAVRLDGEAGHGRNWLLHGRGAADELYGCCAAAVCLAGGAGPGAAQAQERICIAALHSSSHATWTHPALRQSSYCKGFIQKKKRIVPVQDEGREGEGTTGTERASQETQRGKDTAQTEVVTQQETRLPLAARQEGAALPHCAAAGAAGAAGSSGFWKTSMCMGVKMPSMPPSMMDTAGAGMVGTRAIRTITGADTVCTL